MRGEAATRFEKKRLGRRSHPRGEIAELLLKKGPRRAKRLRPMPDQKAPREKKAICPKGKCLRPSATKNRGNQVSRRKEVSPVFGEKSPRERLWQKKNRSAETPKRKFRKEKKKGRPKIGGKKLGRE